MKPKWNFSLAVAKNLVEERPEFTLLAREVELGVVGQGLGQVQLYEPGGHFAMLRCVGLSYHSLI